MATWWDSPQRFSAPWEEFIRVGDKLHYKATGDHVWRELELQKAKYLSHEDGGGIFKFTDIATGRRGELLCDRRAATVVWLSGPGIRPTDFQMKPAGSFRSLSLGQISPAQEPRWLFRLDAQFLLYASRWKQAGKNGLTTLTQIGEFGPDHRLTPTTSWHLRVLSTRPVRATTSGGEVLSVPIINRPESDATWDGRKLTLLSLGDFNIRHDSAGRLASITRQN